MKKLLLLCLFLSGIGFSYAQVSTTVDMSGSPIAGSPFSSLAAAVTAVNGLTITGPVVVTAAAGSETNPAGGYAITATGTSTNTIIIQGAGAGSTIITAPNPAGTAGALNDAIFKIIGGDYITIQGFGLYENPLNTTTAAVSNNMVEWGVAVLYAGTTNNSQNITITGNTIDLNRTYQNTFGIYVNATHSATAPSTSATATGTNGGNHGLIIQSNTITDVNLGIVVVGPTAAADMNNGVTIGGSALTANTITNFGTTGTFSSYANVSGTVNGILIRNSVNYLVSYNTVASSIGGVTAGTLNGIQQPAFSSVPTGAFTNSINNNSISLQPGAAAIAVNGINCPSGSASTTSSMNINGNDFNTFGHTVAASGAITFITNASTHFNQSISNNTFTNITVNTTGNVTFISNSNNLPANGTKIINNNSIVTAFSKTGAGGTVLLYNDGASSTTGSSVQNNNNNFSNITLTGATTISGWQNTDGTGSTPAKTLNGNIFNNWICGTNAVTVLQSNYGNTISMTGNTITNINGQAAVTGIIIGSSGTYNASLNLSSNIITGLSSTGSGMAVTGINFAAPAPTTGVNTVNTNTINTLSSTSNTATVAGITTSGNGVNISNNTIFGLSCIGATSGVTNGIMVTGGASVNVFKNKIYDLTTTGAYTTTPGVNGIVLSSGGATGINVYNNLIGDLKAPVANSTDAIRGISITSTSTLTNYNVYYNTVYLDASSTGINFGTTGIYHAASTTAGTAKLDLRNNIIVNNSTPSGTGLVVVYRRSNGIANMLNNYAGTSNNNLLYASNASALIYSDGTSTAATMAAYKSGVFTAGTIAPRDNFSISLSPAFLSTTGSNANYLHISPASSAIESGGANIATYTDDYDGNIRAGNPGYILPQSNGGGSAPDIGADEYDGIPSYDCVTPTPGSTQTTANNICYGQSITLSMSTPPSTTGNTYQWESSPDDVLPYSPISGANSSTYTFTPTASMYYRCLVTCQNSVTPPSATSTPIQITFAYDITSTTPNSRCGTGTVSLAAAANGGTINWYGSPSGGSAIGTGSPWITPSINTTTTYYVAAETSSSSSGNVTIGTGTSLTSSSGYPTAFGNYWYQDWQQIVFTAAELQAAGLSAGNITGIKFNCGAAAGPASVSGYTISIANTALSTLSGFTTTGLTTVFGPIAYTSASGINSITFSTPYPWDGTSNILLDIRGTGAYGSANATTYYTSTAGISVVYAYSSSNNSSFWTSNPTASTSSSRLNLTFTGTMTTVCSSPRSAVVATVYTPPALTITGNQTICNNAVQTIQVTSTIGDFDSYTWSPQANLFTDPGCSTGYNGENLTTVYFQTTTAGSYTFTCSATNSGTNCANTASSTIINLPSGVTVTPTPATLCLSGTAVFAAVPSSGYGAAEFQWQYSTDNSTFYDVSGATTLAFTTPTLTATTYYKLQIKVGGNVCVESGVATVTVNTPQVTGTAPGHRCGPGTVDLGATGSAGTTLNWYAAASGGSSLGTGENFTTPALLSTTNYYVSASIQSSPVLAGRLAPATTSSDYWFGYGLVFDATSAILINSVVVYPSNTTPANMTVRLLDNTGVQVPGTSDVVFLPVAASGSTPQIVPLNYQVPAGTGYRLVIASGMGSANKLVQETSGYTYPIVSGPVTITSNWNATYTSTAYYDWFYSWDVTPTCESARTTVTATINTPPAITATATPSTICSGQSSLLEVSSSNPGYTYAWSDGETTLSHSVSPLASTAYTVTATDDSGGPYDGCSAIETVMLTVNQTPPQVIVTPASAAFCDGTIQQLDASGVNFPPTILSEDFNGTAAGWPTVNNSSGGTPADAAWTLRADGYTYNSTAFHSNDNSQFYMSNSDDQGSGGTTNTELISPVINTNGYVSVSLSFWHYFRSFSGSSGRVEISTDGGTTWNTTTPLAEYTTTQGGPTTFTQVTIDLTGFINYSNLRIRFKYQGSYAYYWCVDNVSVTGTSATVNVTWSPTTSLFTDSGAGTPYGGGIAATVWAQPSSDITYIARATAQNGCYTEATSDLTVYPLPAPPTGNPNQSFCAINNPVLDDISVGNKWVGFLTWYDAATGGNVLPGTTLLTDGATYYASWTDVNNCESATRLAVTVTVSDPAPPTGDAIQGFCAIWNSTIADIVVSGTGITWYDAATGGNVLDPSTLLTNATSYYASSTEDGCEGTIRKEVTVYLSDHPAPTGPSPQIFCSTASPVLDDLEASATGAIFWYSVPTGGNPLPGTTPLVSGTTYYAANLETDNCESTARLAVEVIIGTEPPMTCEIMGNGACGNTSNFYYAPFGMAEYHWQVSGPAYISGPDNDRQVEIITTAATGTIVVGLETTDPFNCTSYCSRNFAIGGPVTTIDHPVICQGPTTIDIPVRVSGFTNVASINLHLGYDHTLIANPTVVYTNPALWPSLPPDFDGFNVNTANVDEIIAGGFGSGITLPDNSILFTLRFDLLIASGTAAVTFLENTQGTFCEYAMDDPPFYTVFCDTPFPDFYIPGGVTVNPVPTMSGASQSAPVCPGDGAVIILSGMVPNSTSTIDWEFNNVPQAPLTGVVANASGEASFTTDPLYYFNNGWTLTITGITITSATPNCSGTFNQVVTLQVNPEPSLDGVSQQAVVCDGFPATILLSGMRPNTTCTITYTIDDVLQPPVTGVISDGSGNASFLTRVLTLADDLESLIITSITITSATPNCSGTFSRGCTLSVSQNPTLASASQPSPACSGTAASIDLFGLLPNTTSTVSYTINGFPQPDVTGVVSGPTGQATFQTVPLSMVNNGQVLQITGITNTGGDPVCSSSFAVDMILNVIISVGGSAAPDQTICYNTAPGNISVTGFTGIVLKWQSSADAGFTSPVDIPVPFATLPGVVIGNLTQPTWFRAVVQLDGCTEDYSSPAMISINPLGQVNQPNSEVACIGQTVNVNFTTLNGGGTTTYLWTNSNPGIGLAGTGNGNISFAGQNSGTSPAVGLITVFPTYSFNGVYCTGTAKQFTITINPSGQVNGVPNQLLCSGASTSLVHFTTVNGGGNTTYNWTNDNTSIGLAPSGSGDILPFTATNTGLTPAVATITVTPTFEHKSVFCTGTPITFTITVYSYPQLVTNNQAACSPNKVNLTLPAVTAGSFLPAGTVLTYWMNAACTVPVPNPAAVTTGTYYIKATNNGCYDVEPVNVTIHPLPLIIAGTGSGSYCTGGPGLLVGLASSEVGVNYTLYLGLTPMSPAIPGTGGPISFGMQSLPGSYWVLAENTTTHCTNRMYNCIYIEVLPLPVVTIDPAGPVYKCPGSPVTLTASGGVQYLWSNAETTSSITVTATGTYMVTATDIHGCSNTASVEVFEYTPPTAQITPDGPTTFCQGGSVMLTASGGTSYLWSTSQTTASITVTTSGTYTVTVTDVHGCQDFTSIPVTVNPLPLAEITPDGPTTFCDGGSVSLTASGGTGYIWSTGETIAAITVTTTGTYSVTVTDGNGCSNTASQSVTVNPLPNAMITPDGPTTFCQGGSVLLTASGGTGYLWSTAATTAAISVNTSGTYTVTVTSEFGCTNVAEQVVTVYPLPTASITPDGPTTFCQGGSVTLTASGGVGYLWSNSATTAAITVNSSGTYVVTVTDGNGCINTASQTVTVNAPPVAVITPNGPTTFCQGGSVILTASGGTSYLWSNAATTASITIAATGTYSVTVTDGNGCSGTASQQVTVHPRPNAIIIALGPTTFCQGGSVNLMAMGGTSYLWSNAATTATITVTTSGTYTVTVTNSYGCTNTAHQTITVNPLPIAAITPDGPTTFCNGGSVILTASGGGTYLWSTAATTSAITVTTGGTYTVTVTSSAGCKATASQAVTVNPLPVAVITPDGPTSFCDGGSVTLTASGGTGYLWSNAATTAAITVATGGTYTVTVTNSYGCTGVASQSVTILPLPAATITPDGPTTFCEGGSVLLTASGGTGYLWSNAATTAAITVASSGNYTVTVTNSYGCQNSASQAVTVNPVPTALITPDGPTIFCQGGSVTLTASGGLSYLWSNGATTQAITVSTTGSYAVTVSNQYGCSDDAFIPVTVHPLPEAFTVTGGGIYCEGDPGVMVGLSGSQAGVNYTLVPAGTVVPGTGGAISFGLQTAGTYTVTASDPATTCNNLMTGSAVVTAAPVPVLVITNPQPACAPAAVNITLPGVTAGSTLYGATLTYWLDQAASNPMPDPAAAGPGTYYIKATTTYGCYDIQPVTVTESPTPVLVTHNQESCVPETINLTAPGVTAGSTLYGATLTYWTNPGATIPVPDPTSVVTGTYYIKATTSFGCFDIESVTVTQNPLPTIFTGTGSGGYCPGGPGLLVGLSGSQVGVTYTLYLGFTQMSAPVAGTGGPISFGTQTEPGSYWVLAENMTTHCINRMYDCIQIILLTPVPVSVTISTMENPVPANSLVRFTAVVANGGSSPVYQWKVNGFNAGTNSPIFNYYPVNGDQVTCTVTSSLPCTSNNPATSNTITMTVTGVPTGTITVTGGVSGYETKCYNATGTIIVAGNGTTFIVNPFGSVTFIAGVNILFKEGTRVLPGAYLLGKISNTYCGAKEASLVTAGLNEGEPVVSLPQTQFRLYPNPTNGNFTIELISGQLPEQTRVEILGLHGERVLSQTMGGERKREFSVTGFPAGLYFVKIISGEAAQTIKLIKTQ